ncbi:FAD synthase-like [Pararge aegeria]|uniref:FAD synthase n=2 Tax=Pararge aegeria TaxID=116150 RepID=A0A8S4R8Y2_9NEOP|nr:FAD synthase-like [Pararge aegeria]XP_039748763.1 FAD synthase-like [Pararge aegeria]CAH2232484.1 jg19417 [Pararge aegeria aegeria]
MDFEDIDTVVNESEEIIRECFKEFQIDEVFLSFNGGKDCTVLLDLLINVLDNIKKSNGTRKNLKIVYIRTKGPFSEIESFAQTVEDHYDVKLIVMEGEMKTTLHRILESDSKLKACFMGTRRSDPYSEDLKFMQKTDPNWPQIVRVSPLLNWSYHQIWSYILKRKVPYCSLYDRGYTSIGSIHNTSPNPALAYKDKHGSISYHPAWKLSDPSLERAGRGSKTSLNGRNQNGHTDSSTLENNVCSEKKSDIV